MGEDQELDEILKKRCRSELIATIIGVPIVILALIWAMYVAFFAPSELPDSIEVGEDDSPDPEDVYGSY
jgi:flagellar basal body-associated protein FliL